MIFSNPFRKARRPTDDEIVNLVPREPSIFGRDLRSALGEAGFAMNGAEFYSRMAKLEDAGRVLGSYEPRTVAGHPFRERAYRRVQADGDRATANRGGPDGLENDRSPRR